MGSRKQSAQIRGHQPAETKRTPESQPVSSEGAERNICLTQKYLFNPELSGENH